MRQRTTMTTGRASLCALGEYWRRHCFLAPLRDQGQIRQKTVRSRPLDKRLEALGGIRCGAKTMAQQNVTIRTDRAVPRACGRTGCAEPSTMARPLRACPAEHVAQLAQGAWYDLKRYGAPPRHRCHDKRLWVDVARTPRPIGAQAEGSERPWRGRNRRKTGRQTWRLTASASRARLHEPFRRGKASAVPAFTSALSARETRLGWTREHRRWMVRRLEGGVGTTAVRTWGRNRGEQVVAKSSHSGRVPQWRQHLGPWPPTSSPGRAMAAGLRLHRCCRTTRQWVRRTPKATSGYP
jgi:hypothetical protein